MHLCSGYLERVIYNLLSRRGSNFRAKQPNYCKNGQDTVLDLLFASIHTGTRMNSTLNVL